MEEYTAGQFAATDENDESIVISGISGVFPATNDMRELEHNLRSKRNLVSGGVASSFNIGKIPHIEKFDAAYFGIKPEYADSMDPMGRLLLEKTYEAIIDSGYNPECLRGKKVGVFIGIFMSETEAAYYTNGSSDDMAITGASRSFLANRISFCFGFHGPSFCVDTACSSSMHALHLARQAIRNDECDSAIVGGCNLCLNNGITLHLQKMGVVSKTGESRVLDEAGNGYCRAETVCSLFLQKRKHARRIYASLIHTKVNCDGYKPEGITYPSYLMQKQLLTEFYRECDVEPSSVNWLELHATGTIAGDREEVKAIQIFCQNRHAVLKVGSIRSNMGHAEAASSMCSIAKVIIAMKSGVIPPNINYTTPRNDIDALHNGTVEVITENTPWNGGLVGINSFGVGGSNAHALLKSFEKRRTPTNEGSSITDDLPRLVTASGRTLQAVDAILSELEKNPIDDEYVSLLHDIHGEDIVRHLYRGGIIRVKNSAQVLFKEIAHCPLRKRPVWFIFAGMGCQWAGMGKRLMKLPIFAQSIAECDRVLQSKNVNLIRIISDDSEELLDNILNCFVAISAMQIAFVDVLRALNVVPAGIIGHSAGEIACAYADGCLTKEQTILCAYYRGLSCLETDLVTGAMAAIGLAYEELEKRLPLEVDIACWNSARNCTISGPKEKVNEMVNHFQAENVFVRQINSSNIAFHSRYVKPVGSVLLRHLQKVIPNARLRSEKWISTSILKRNSDNAAARYCSAEYLVNNLESMVLFEEAAKQIPENAIVVEVSPHSLLRAILHQIHDANVIAYIPLGAKQCPDSLEYLLKSTAKLFLTGETPKLRNLYPIINYPVSKETPMIAPLVKWQHDHSWNVVFSKKEDMVPGERRYTFLAKSKQHAYLFDHAIDGRNVVPGTAYLLPLWETVPLMYNKKMEDASIVFEKLRFQKMVTLHRNRNTTILLHIQKGSGNFEIVENNELVLSGKVRILDDDDGIDEHNALPWSAEQSRSSGQDHDRDEDDAPLMQLNQEDIYKEFQLRGFEYKNLFRQLLRSNYSGTRARVKWNDNWIAFLDTLTQTHILRTDTRHPCLLTAIEKLVVNVKAHRKVLQNLEYQQKGIPVYVDENLDSVVAGGVEIRGIKGYIIPRRKLQKEPQLLVYKFMPYFVTSAQCKLEGSWLFCFYGRLLWQNVISINMKILEYAPTHSKHEYHSVSICRALNHYPHVQMNAVVVSKNNRTSSSSNESQTNIPFVKLVDESREIDANFKAHLLITDLTDDLQDKLAHLVDEGFLMIRAKLVAEIPRLHNFVLCSQHVFGEEKLITLRRNVTVASTYYCVKITQTFEWLETLKEEIRRDDREIILYSEGDVYTGAMGFFNCLRKEMPNKRIRLFSMLDEDVPAFSPYHSFYEKQISRNLLVNVYKDKMWGCYVHFPMRTITSVCTPYAFANVGVTGDLRTLNWYQGNAINLPLNCKNANLTSNDVKFIHVYFAALNFKDVLLASGMLSHEVFVPNRIMQECLIGCEFSGRDNEGKRYMGMYPAGAISTILLASKSFLWEIPNNWSLEEAATVPVVYLTVIAAFFVHGNLKKGESVLIHSGAGGVGQAAINIATFYECEIFTTVGTIEKREFIKKTFPHIKDSHIGNSRDTTFEKLVMTETKGKGVDLVLNSLAEDKLQASVRCLARGGRFLEIGKLDLLKDNALGMNIFLRGVSFHCVLLDKIHEEKNDVKNSILERFRRELESGSIRPIVRTIFDADDVESAFRYMASGKHIGKVLIKLRDEERQPLALPTLLQKNAVPRFSCEREKVYIICGGLGGMGLEVADWLVLRGAKKLILTSRVGVVDGYQKMRINLWESYGTTVVVRTDDVAKPHGVENLLRVAENLGPVCAIFNLALVLDDKMFENQDASAFEAVAAPKREATRLLDEVSRKLCPNLEYFVVFSTLSCGYGNPAQTNYGFANSCCERICEVRKEQGLPALAIQWGVVGDVGILTRMDIEKTCHFVGLKQQPIRSCLNVMDKFLNQPETLVSSLIVDDKNVNVNERGNLVETVANILGVKDMNSISIYSPLPELGMDSISGLEVKQTLEQQYDIFLSPKELISLTFAELELIQRTGRKSLIDVKNENSVVTSIPNLRSILLNKAKKINLLDADLVVRLPSGFDQHSATSKCKVFCFPAIDGIATSLETLSKNTSLEMLCFQYIAVKKMDSVVKQAEIFASYILETIPPTEQFNILAYSYGVIIAIETIKILHGRRKKGKVMLIDGSVEFAKTLRSIYFGGMNDLNDIQVKVIIDVISSFQPTTNVSVLQNDLTQLSNWDTKLNYMTSAFSTDTEERENVKFIANYLYQTYKSINEYDFTIKEKLVAQVAVIRAKRMVIPLPADTGLNKYFNTILQETWVDENHFTILHSKQVAEIVDSFFKK